jgi:hypothetical protein
VLNECQHAVHTPVRQTRRRRKPTRRRSAR